MRTVLLVITRHPLKVSDPFIPWKFTLLTLDMFQLLLEPQVGKIIVLSRTQEKYND